MKKVLQRLIMFAVGLPLVVGIVVLLPQRNHAAANMIITLLSSFGALEFSDIIGKKGYRLSLGEAAILGSLAPLAMTLSVSFNVNGELVPGAFILGASWLIASRTFSSIVEVKSTVDRIIAGLSVMIYPGVFMLWIVRMSLFANATTVILVFLLIVFANDSFAWAVGMLWGKGNRGVVPASPNKSVAGFIGGLSASILIGALAPIIFPQVFASSRIPDIAAGIILGFVTGVVAIIGDLAESTIKRSGEVKDSGVLILGRGGVLDSIDSLALAAPVFYALHIILYR
jgi:phosphatidate cytidylyltransferase